jgi:hypothetical protein
MDVVASPEKIAKRLSMFRSYDFKAKGGIALGLSRRVPVGQQLDL